MVDLYKDTDTREAIELLYRGYRAFTAQADRILEKRGLGRAHHRILYFVGRDPDVSIADLLDALAITKQALNIPLKQLVGMGLVNSRQAGHDGRVKLLKLTANGKRLEARLSNAQATMLQQMFDEVGPDAEDAWRAAMHVLARKSI